ncbi:MAG TPA: phospholipase D-like domain-containing protein, partial [Gemmatimonadaceae bacterium]|nr:phospholipase D-like domain-containing protein [Gemmatimonadaceae bacterium]
MIDWVIRIGAGLLLLVTVAFAFVGFLHVTRGTPVHRMRAPGDDGPPAVRDRLFCDTIAMLTKSHLTSGHRIEVMTCGDETYPRLWEDLRAARRSITLQMYYCQPGRMADEFAEIITERARAGVRVLFLRDAFGSAPLGKDYIERLKAGGVQVAEFRPTRWWELHKVQHRSHIRVVVLDGTVGYTGGFGIDDKWFGDGRHEDQWRDTNVRFEGPAVMQHQATFAAAWAEATGTLIAGELFFPGEATEPAAGSTTAGLLYAAPTLGSTAAERFMAMSIAAARQRLYVSNAYFVPNDQFVEMLVDAARRGVDVRVLTSGERNDVQSTRWAGRTQYERLLAGGVRLFEYLPTMIHAKTLVADGAWSGIGTLNFDNRSFAFNDETML